MAELIPISYRVRVAQRAALTRWAVYGTIVLAVAGAGVAYAWTWQRRQAQALEQLQADYRARSPVIESARDMRTKWARLVDRREGHEKLRDDTTLLALFRHVSQATQEFDCLEQVTIDARKGADGAKDAYFVRLTGVTEDPATLAALMKRLSTGATPPVNVTLETSKREQYLDGYVLRFHILCQRPQG